MLSSKKSGLYTFVHNLFKFWRWLVNPVEPYEDIETQHKSRLLAVFILVLIVIFSGVMIYYVIAYPGTPLHFYRYIPLIFAFILNRYKHYTWAAIILVATFPLAIFSTTYGGVVADPRLSLRYLVLGLVLSSIFLESAGTIVLTLFNTTGILLIPVLAPEMNISYASLFFPATTNLMAGPLLVMMKRHRDRIEKDRQLSKENTESRLQAIFDHSPLGIIVISPTTQILEANQEFSKMTGYSNVELSTMNMIEMTYPDDAQHSAKFIRKVLTDKIDTYTIEQRLVKKNGESVWINFIGNILRNEDGQIAFGVGLAEDITERRLTEHALQENIIKFQGFMEQSTDGITLVDQEGFITEWSHGMENLTGIDADQAIGEKVWDVQLQITPQERRTAKAKEAYKAISEEIIQTGMVNPDFQRMEIDFENSTGEQKTMQIVTFPIKTDKSTMIGSIHRDITERKQAETRLQNITRELQEAQRIANLGSWSNNVATGETIWSDQVYRIFGYEPDSDLSPVEIFDRHMHPDDKEEYFQTIKSYFFDLEQNEFKDLHLRIISPKGDINYLTTSGEHFTDSNGKRIGARGTIFDITEIMKAEEALKVLAIELERSNKELEQFAYIASHDLQEPLRKIQAFSDRLETKYKEVLDIRGQDFLTRMRDAANRGQIMVEALLTYSRVSTRGKPFIRIDLNQVLQDVVSDLELRIEDSQGTVRVEDLPVIDADPAQMRQLFQNLISNGLKFYQPDQKPFVEVSSLVQSPNRVQISVRDHGIGFDTEYSERIFQPFQRLNTRQEYEGSGIGLAVCRKIVERHGGEISTQSESGKGATFYVTLPIEQNIEVSRQNQRSESIIFQRN